MTCAPLPPRNELSSLPHVVQLLDKIGRTVEKFVKGCDQFGKAEINQVLRNMRQVLALRPGKAFMLEAMKEKSPAAKTSGESIGLGTQIVRGGRLVATTTEASPVQSQRTEVEGHELSLFEKIFLARFGAGLPFGEELLPGMLKFLSKTEKIWLQFFQKFLPFTFEKQVNPAEIASVIFRGLLQGKNAGPKGETIAYLIADLKMLSGKMEKFVRVRIQGDEAVLRSLQETAPGKILDPATVAEWIGKEPPVFLALSYKVVNPEALKNNPSELALAYQTPEAMVEAGIREGTRNVTQGIALSARTEQAMAERLDINLAALRGLDRSSKEGEAKTVPPPSGFAGLFWKKKKRGAFGSMFEGGEGSPPTFVPWYQWMLRTQKVKGKPRWWVPLLYFTAVSVGGLFLVYVLKFLLQR